MNLISKIIKSNDAASDLITAINNAGASVVSLLGTCAAVISTLIASVGAIVLLVVCVATMWKARQGNSDAWGDAMQLIATVGAVMCFSASVMAIFF